MTPDNQSLPLLPVPDYFFGSKGMLCEDCYAVGTTQKYGDARAAHARKQALEDAAKVCDSAGHLWSGATALALFNTANEIKELK